ncbi:unnamed protein product, partial [marine sediment metagenome]
TRTRHTSPLVHITAAAPANFLIYTLSAGRTARIKKIMLMNNTVNVDHVILGEMVTIPPAPAAFVARLPAVYVLAGFDERVFEYELPEFEFTSNIYVQADSAGLAALTPEDIIVELEEIG